MKTSISQNKHMKMTVLFIVLSFSILNLNAQLRVNSTGKVGVAGTAATYGSLQINKDGANNGLAIYNNSSTPFRFFKNGTIGYISRNDTTASCIKMDSVGQVTIGQTPTGNGFGNQLGVYGNGIPALMTRFYYPPNNGGDGTKSIVEQPLNNTLVGYYKPSNGSWQKTFYVQGTGTLYCGGTISYSDKAWKSDIKAIENPLSIIGQLNGVTYKNERKAAMKADYYNSLSDMDKDWISKDSTYDKEYADILMSEMDKRDMGLVAQEVEKVLPDIVYNVEKDKKGIAYQQLIALLIEGIKAQQKEIEALQITVADLQYGTGDDAERERSNGLSKDSPILYQNTPNPFSASTDINYYLPTTIKSAFLCICNLQGKQLKRYNLSSRGSSTLTISANELNPGIYLYALIADGSEAGVKRMIISE